MVDTCAAEFESETPYFYGTYEDENESIVTDKKSVIVLGSGPIRIGQGVEFDYATVHYCGQIVTLTYPLIGNYGINRDSPSSRQLFWQRGWADRKRQ